MILFTPLAWLAGTLVGSGTDADARLPYWEAKDAAVSIRLVQRLPDQTRAFFLARGFKVDQIEPVALSCVFQTIVKNTSTKAAPVTMTYDLRDWVIHAGGAKHKMKTREDWKPVHEASGVSPPARLAFDWALLPTRQEYNAGDYGWGMSVFGLKPGARFDLELVWQQDGRPRRARLKDIECAPDIHPEPSAE
jgi:hypothetical protein